MCYHPICSRIIQATKASTKTSNRRLGGFLGIHFWTLEHSQKSTKVKVLRMGSPGPPNLSQLYGIILILSGASQLPYKANIEKYWDSYIFLFPYNFPIEGQWDTRENHPAHVPCECWGRPIQSLSELPSQHSVVTDKCNFSSGRWRLIQHWMLVQKGQYWAH